MKNWIGSLVQLALALAAGLLVFQQTTDIRLNQIRADLMELHMLVCAHMTKTTDDRPRECALYGR